MDEDKQGRRQFTAQQKADAVKRHVMGKEEVSVICQSIGIAPNQFYRWQQELFENAAAAFSVKTRGRKADPQEARLVRRVEELESKIAHKDEVIAELAEECIATKKKLGLS